MTKTRLEAFSDGVVAIIITIMVLELRAPHVTDWSSLQPLIPTLLGYILSFTFVGIYWSNHHHLLQAVRHVTGGTLWANLHLLFWLSLIPFVTGIMSENEFTSIPVALYGIVLLGAAIAYTILVRVLLRHHGPDSLIAQAIGSDVKGNFSLALYVGAIPLAFWHPLLACGLYVIVAVVWLVPDRRIERVIDHRES